MLIFVKNDDCVSHKMTFHHVFIYLDLVCILYPVCSLQSAVCSLHFVLTAVTDSCGGGSERWLVIGIQPDSAAVQ